MGDRRGTRSPEEPPEPSRAARTDSFGRFMIDPSLLLTEEPPDWASAQNIRDTAYVSAAFKEALAHPDLEALSVFTTRRDRVVLRRAVAELAPVVAELKTFSRTDAGELPEGAQRVAEILERSTSPAAKITLDQWAYLASRSWLTAKNRAFVNRIRRAGVIVLQAVPPPGARELAYEKMRELAGYLIPESRLPPVLTPELWQRAEMKWVMYMSAGSYLHPPYSLLSVPFLRLLDP